MLAMMSSKSVRSILIMSLLFAESLLAAGDEAFTESVVIFNTICAKCHEAECSGRLSFDDAFEVSATHIIRHYGEAAGKQWLQKELFVLLNHMKEKCAYYPMQVPIPPKRVWSGELLEKMTTLLEKNYFIPIGTFSPGRYSLEITLARDEKITVHLVAETFDMLVEDCYDTNDKKVIIPFSVEETGNYYLRVYPRTPTRISQLIIHKREPQ